MPSRQPRPPIDSTRSVKSLTDDPRTLVASIQRARAAVGEGVARMIQPTGSTPRPGPAVGPPPADNTALDLFNRGLAHLRRHEDKAAYRTFLEAYRSGGPLDRYRKNQLEGFLQDLAPRNQLATSDQPATLPDDPSPIDEARRQQAIVADKFRSRTFSVIFEAQRLKEKDPDKAIEEIDRLLAEVGEANLDKVFTDSIVARLSRARRVIQEDATARAPQLAQLESNREVEEQLRSQQENDNRIEQEFKALVEKYNQADRDGRYLQMELIGKQARELDPYAPEAMTMVLKARFKRRDASNNDLRERKEDSDLGEPQPGRRNRGELW